MFHDYKPNAEQFKVINRLNESEEWLPLEVGYMSDGCISLHMRRKNEPHIKYIQTIEASGAWGGCIEVHDKKATA